MNFFTSNFFYFLLGQLTITIVNAAIGMTFIRMEIEDQRVTEVFRTAITQRVQALEEKGKQVDVLKQKVEKKKDK